MKKIITSSVLITFIFFRCYSQSDFGNGYLITNTNDTVFGLINDLGKTDNSLKCIFRLDSKSDKITYYPDDIKAYRFTNDKYYVSKAIKPGDTEKVFLEFMFDGIVDLYYFYNDSGDHYYITRNDSVLTELKNEINQVYISAPRAGVSRNYSENTPTLFERESKEYIGLLKNFFIDSPACMKKAESLSLSHNPLIEIAEDYHNEVCPGESCIKYSKNKIKIVFRIGPFAGISFSRISFSQQSTVFRFDPLSGSTGVKFGISLNIADPFASRKISFQIEPAMNKVEYLSDIASLKLVTMEMPVLVKYTFPYKKVQPSIMIGPMISNILKFETYSDSYSNFDFENKASLIGFTSGIETLFKFNQRQGFFVQLRYEYSIGQHNTGIWDDMPGNFNITLNNLNLLAGIRF